MQTTSKTERFHQTFASASVLAGIAGVIGARYQAFTTARQNRRKVREMLTIDQHLLDDIGLSRGDILDALTSSRERDPVQSLNERRNERLALKLPAKGLRQSSRTSNVKREAQRTLRRLAAGW